MTDTNRLIRNMTMRRALAAVVLVCVFAPSGTPEAAPADSARRPIWPDDVMRLRSVAAPRIAPSGEWVAYTVESAVADTDEFITQLHLTRIDSSEDFQVTFGKEGASDPEFSPDGAHLSFLSARADPGMDADDADAVSQVFLLRLSGGEAVQVSRLPGGVEEYAWAPDGQSLVLVGQDPEPEELTEKEQHTSRPIVTERYHFKQDEIGYQTDRRAHLYLLDLDSQQHAQITSGPYDHHSPRFSPDGRLLAFVSNRGVEDVDRTGNTDVFVMEARAGAEPRRLTDWTGPDNSDSSSPLAWSPDGKYIAYLQGDESRFYAYDQEQLAVVPVEGGISRVLTADLDRPVLNPEFSPDGRQVYFLVTDDRAQYLAKVPVAGGPVEPIFRDRRVISAFDTGVDGRTVLIAASAREPAELFSLERRALRPLSRHNAAWLAEVTTGRAEEFSSRSKDGTVVNGIVTRPATAAAGERLPAVLLIHGGPDGQDAHDFDHEREVFAAAGYLVIQANYRGSNGRGAAFQKSIYADWGNKEVIDLIGALDHFIALGAADPERVASVGWSYGGILTNYLIASDTRFKAAASTAGSAMMVIWGIDQYSMQYELELGPPWKTQDLWIKLSYPFFHADRIKTPTLFLCGEKDFNVPLAGSEQMYQALKSLGVPTQLVIYPDLYHSLDAPSALQDRLERQLAWLRTHMGSTGSTPQ